MGGLKWKQIRLRVQINAQVSCSKVTSNLNSYLTFRKIKYREKVDFT